MNQTFDLNRLIRDVFAPDERDVVLVMVDMPTAKHQDNPEWEERRLMAGAWREGFYNLGIRTQPLLFYPATGANNSDLPASGFQDRRPVMMERAIASATIVIAITRFSATAPLSIFTQKYPSLRAASMPNVLKRMELSALAADYREVARKANILAAWLNEAEEADVLFSTGHRISMDLRYRQAHADDGMCRHDKTGFRVINLPSGEAFIVPYEGEIPGVPSRTSGEIPLPWKGHLYVLTVRENRITFLTGDGPDRDALNAIFAVDQARRNIAEMGLGCNDRAIITGNVLEDEKAGFHWAYGRSEHLGGVVGPSNFTDPAHVVHHDVVYAKGCPVEIRRLELVNASGVRRLVILDGAATPVFKR